MRSSYLARPDSPRRFRRLLGQGRPKSSRTIPADLWITGVRRNRLSARDLSVDAMTRDVFRPPPFHEARPGLVRPVRVDPRGLSGPTPDAARGRRYRRTSRGYYLPASVDGAVPEQRIVEASMVLPRFGGVTGWAALRWAGGGWFDGQLHGGRGTRPVTLGTGYSDVRDQPGIKISQERLGPSELLVLDGMSVTSHVRSVCFEMRYAAGLRAAVLALDMAAYSDLVSIEEAADYALLHSGWTGIPQCRAALGLSEENSWSPQETMMRLIWVLDAGLPAPLCNVPIFDRQGRHLGTPDLLDVEGRGGRGVRRGAASRAGTTSTGPRPGGRVPQRRSRVLHDAGRRRRPGGRSPAPWTGCSPRATERGSSPSRPDRGRSNRPRGGPPR